MNATLKVHRTRGQVGRRRFVAGLLLTACVSVAADPTDVTFPPRDPEQPLGLHGIATQPTADLEPVPVAPKPKAGTGTSA